MRNMLKKTALFAVMASFAVTAFAQGIQPDLQYYRLPGYDGLNVFETGKNNEVEYDGFKVRLGGDFALQYQFLNHEAMTSADYSLIKIGKSVNLPTANLNIDAQLANGMRVHLRTYLSSRHHVEAWVKGGYIQIDRLDFIKEGFAEGLMEIMTVKAGVDNFSYGDAVFRRSDNANAIYNPFVGNYLMDNNTAEPFLEFQFFPSNFIVVGGVGTGILNPTVVRKVDPNDPTNTDPNSYKKVSPSFWAKLGWDSQVNNDLRVRITGSIYSSSDWDQGYRLYGGDRAGARYYKIFDYQLDSTGARTTNDFSGRINPGLRQLTAFQINPFVKFMGLEFFGIYEVATGFSRNAQFNSSEWTRGSYTQIGAELIYRFGGWDQFYLAGRYNTVTGKASYLTVNGAPQNMTANRLNIGGGWFMTKNVLVKVEFVQQQYDENWTSTANNLKDGKMNGVVFEAVIGF